MSEIINKVSASGLVTVNLEEIYPEGRRAVIDIAPQLWQGIALREKDFREWIRTHDWNQYREAWVAVHCSADAIVPHWAYMLVASALTGVAGRVILGTAQELESLIFRDLIYSLDRESFRDARVVIKGCSDREVPASAYSDLVHHLQPVVKSLMFGEPCSTVPVYKRPKQDV
jgi:hypothetical protein